MSVQSNRVDNEMLFAQVNTLFAEKKYDQAAELLNAIPQTDADLPRILRAGAAIACERGDLEQARRQLTRSLDLEPDNAAACNSMGNVLLRAGSDSEARIWFERAVKCDPDLAAARYNLGLLDLKTGNLEGAAGHLERVVAVQPAEYGHLFYLGVALTKMGRFQDALRQFERAIELQPARFNAWMGAIHVHSLYGRSIEAEELCRRGLEATSDHVVLLVKMGTILLNQGRVAEAEEFYRKTLAKDSSFPEAYASLMYALNYDPGAAQEEIHSLAVRWDRVCCGAIPSNDSFVNDADPERPLRIGYVSGDFQTHPVALHLLPVLRNHDQSRYSVYCYSNLCLGDDTTREIMALSNWRMIAHLGDEEAAALVRGDQIDILIDLSGHTGDNRLTLFAHRPAPVQATWLGYWNTTGLAAMDYLISDDATIPAGEDHLFTEKVLRLPWSRFCFTPFPSLPHLAEPPSISKGYVTFGSFNNLAKINAQVIAAWSKILQEVPDSRLILKRGELGDEPMRERVRGWFAAHGIRAERLDLRGSSQYHQMLAEYNEVDVALDTFPFNGGLTTLDALLMGVPVVTFSGKLPISRQGRSFMRILNLLELVARTDERYCAIACELARDVQRRQALRRELRGRVMASYLCDGSGFTRNLEQAYRTMWRNWCQSVADAAPKAKQRRKKA